MASSLEELLSEEGFKGRKSRIKSRASFRAEVALKSLHAQDRSKTNSPSAHRGKTERTRSDVSRCIYRAELPRSDSSSSRRPRDNLISRDRRNGRPNTETLERHGHLVSNDMWNTKTLNNPEDTEESEITEICEEEDKRILYKGHSSGRSEKSSQGCGENWRYIDRKGTDIKVDQSERINYNENLLKYKASTDDNNISMRQPNPSYDSSGRSSKNLRNLKSGVGQTLKIVSPEVPEFALDEVVIKAMVSILNSYINGFLKDDEFRIMLRQNCLSSLSLSEDGQAQNIESKVITSLEQAIEIVEKAADEAASPKDVKKASLLLSMITGFESNDLKDRYTSGVPNFRLSACAHLYLSVIYKLQKKNMVSAKNLLQVFCDAPFSARAVLLPELWDCLFFPHLSHLKVWYNQEADSLPNTPSRTRKLNLLDRVYNEILDSGTYQFALYYKDWLTEGIDSPSLPYVRIPNIAVQEVQLADSEDHSSGISRSSDPFSPQPMVSKKLYEAVFRHSSKPQINQAEYGEVADNPDNGETTSDGSTVEVKQTLTDSYEIVKYLDQDVEKYSREDTQENTFLSDHGGLTAAKEEWKLDRVSSPKMDINDEISSLNVQQEPAENDHLLQAFSHAKSNELILMSLAKSVFDIKRNEESRDLAISSLSHTNEPIKAMDTYELELDGSREYFDKRSFVVSIPQDFICPLSGQLFEDPVTLETGQTFERKAIRDYFNQGNRTCPVTGKALDCQTVPFTNSILKRVIESWKLDNCSHLVALAFKIARDSGKTESRQRDEAATFILEMLLTTFSREEGLANAKHLVSLGGLEFLIRRIAFGNLEEKTRAAALLICCIEGDASCRNQIAKKIEKHCLFELLQSNHPKSRRNAVLLLTELICLSRRKDVKLFLSGLQNEEIVNAMHILLIYLQNSPIEERPWVAALLLHLDLLVEPQKNSIYREESVDAIAIALEVSLTDEKIREKSCKALLSLGGRFSASGKSIIECWILKEAGFINKYEANSQKDHLFPDDSVSLEDEEETISDWLRNLSISLLDNGKRSFLEVTAKCLASGSLDLVKALLTTIAWLSCALSSLSDADLHLSAFSILISRLKESLENGQQIEHKVLASISLLNFSKIPECRVLLMTIAEEIAVPLRSLVEVTWTAKQLYAIISGEYI